MYYAPDLKYERGMKLLEELKGEEGDAIRYYIKQKDIYTADLYKKLEELRNAIKVLSKYVK